MCAAETKAGGGRDNIFRVKARAEAKARHEEAEEAEEAEAKARREEAEELAANGEAPLVGEAFHDSDDEQDASDLANLAAPDIVDQLREQFGEIRHWVYPCGVVCITSAVDHEAGLGLDASAEATNAFTVLRGWGDAQAPYDVVMFKRQPRTTLVGFPHDAQAPDDAVGLRARALLLRDIAWCERDDLESSSGDEFDSVPPPPSADDQLRIRRLPAEVTYADGSFATDGLRMRTVDTPAQAGGAGASTGKSAAGAVAAASLREHGERGSGRWASAPELEQIAGELIGTREQVLACLRLQDEYRAHRRRCSAASEGENG